MKIIPLDASSFTDKKHSHEYLAGTLHFPAYYGRNLDALADMLSELPRDVGVIFHATADYGDYSENIIETFIDVLGGTRILII